MKKTEYNQIGKTAFPIKLGIGLLMLNILTGCAAVAVGGVGVVVAVTGCCKAVAVDGRSTVAMHEVLNGTLSGTDLTRHRRVAAEGLDLGAGGGHVDRPVVVDLIVAADKH